MKQQLIFTVFLLWSLNSGACDCIETEEVETELRLSEVVLTIRVVEIIEKFDTIELEGVSTKELGRVVTVEVIKAFKGDIEHQYLTVKGSGGNCDIQFMKNVEYLLYADKLGTGELITGVCTRTAKLKGNTDLQILEKKK